MRACKFIRNINIKIKELHNVCTLTFEVFALINKRFKKFGLNWWIIKLPITYIMSGQILTSFD